MGYATKLRLQVIPAGSGRKVEAAAYGSFIFVTRDRQDFKISWTARQA
jgi:hypothetical protein